MPITKSRSYSEWVDETRILAHTDKNVQDAAKMREAAAKKGEKASSANESVSGKKRRADTSAETEEVPEDAASFKLRYTVPFVLKRALVDDWENVTQRYGSANRLLSRPTLKLVCPVLMTQALPVQVSRPSRHYGR